MAHGNHHKNAVRVVKRRSDLEKSDFIVARQKNSGIVDRVVSPKHFQVGIKDNKSFQSCLTVYGGGCFESGITGSLQKLPDGTSYLRGGNNISVTNNSDGSITIATSAGAFSGRTTNALSAGNGLSLNTSPFDGQAASTISISTAAGKGISTTGGVGIDIDSLTTQAPNSSDTIMFRDGSGNLRKSTLANATSAAQSSVTLDHKLTVTDGIQYTVGTDYDNSTDRELKIKLAANPGLKFSSNSLIVAPDQATSKATPHVNDVILIADSEDSSNLKKITVNSLKNNMSTLSNALTIGNGLENTSSQTGFAYNNTAAQEIRVKVNGDTINVGASGISVAKVPGTLSAGAGVSAFTYDGSGNATIAVDTSQFVTYAAAGTFTNNIVFNANLQTKVLLGGDGNDLIKAGSNISISKDATHGTLTIAASNANLNIPGFSAGNPTRVDQVALHDGSTNIKSSAGAVADLFDRTKVANSSNTIDVTTGGVNTPIQMSVKTSGNTISADASGISVQKVPNAVAAGTGIAAFSFDGSSAATVAVDTSVIPRLDGSTFTGIVNFNSGITGSIYNLPSGLPYIIGGSGIIVSTGSNGQVTVAATGGGGGGAGDITRVDAGIGLSGGGQSGDVSLAMDYSGNDSFIRAATDGTGISIDVSNDFMLVHDMTDDTVKYVNPNQLTFSGGTIGNPEEGSYTDGLFTDFTNSTAVGTAIDRFNEILKSLAPSPASNLSKINSTDTGGSAKLSFDSSNPISSPAYTNAAPSGLTPASSLSNVSSNGSYTSSQAGNDFRLGVFDKQTVIDGVLNFGIAADSPNFPANALSDGDAGTLKLFVNNNSTPIHTTNLASFGSGASVNGNGSGFNLSAKLPGHFSDGTNFDTFLHRTGTYSIAINDQVLGWNYARVVHTVNSTDRTTNYIEWVNDNDSSVLEHAGSQLINLSMTGTQQLSGVNYHTGGTATYQINISNLYKNVFPTNAITFTGTNCSVPSLIVPDIDFGNGETVNKTLSISRTATINSNKILNGSINVSTNVIHPLKNNLSGVGSANFPGILVYNFSNNSSVLSETFRTENFRLTSGSYNSQSDVYSGGSIQNSWSSTTSLATVDGLMFYNERMVAPRNALLNGDFSSVANGPAGNVNYSGITTGLRTFYRYFQNTTGGSKSNFRFTANGNGTIVDHNSALNGNKIRVFFKIPLTASGKSTGWMDLAVPFANGQYSDFSGCLIGGLNSTLSSENNASFGVKTVSNGEYILIKIEADASWSGNVSSMSINWS